MEVGADAGAAVRTWRLEAARKHRSPRVPAEHQRKALAALRDWYTSSHTTHGGLLCLPTGAGKTFTAVRFLCEEPLSEGKKVIWLAHTHHLLDQAIETFGPTPAETSPLYEVGHISGERRSLTARVVSGAPGHHSPRHIEASDDVLVATHQTLANAFRLDSQRWHTFLKSCRRTGLVVVFDEAHHAPANTYRGLVERIREAVPETSVLGLTATPDYYDPKRAGWLRELFPQGIVYRADFQQLLAAGVLARPNFSLCPTRFKPSPSAGVVREMKTRFGDLPEEIITRIASSNARNELIARHWLQGQKEFGPTIIFTDRWVQCEAIKLHLDRGGARVGTVYHHTTRSTEGGRAEALRNNARTLDAFRAGELDVLINVRMLTEGTDVPNARTVFLTRQTTSRILLTQMVGRALRGPKFGGTTDASIVSFIDDWGDALPWAEWELPDGDTEDAPRIAGRQQGLEFVSVELVRAFVRALESAPATTGSFLSWIPVGWYEVSYAAQRDDEEDDEDEVETTRRLVIVFDGEIDAFAALFRGMTGPSLVPFVSLDLDTLKATRLAKPLVKRHFRDGLRPGDTPAADVAHVLRHLAQHGTPPTFHPFDRRGEHDLDALARTILERDLGPRRVYELAQHEFSRGDRLWRALFEDSFTSFKAALDAAVSRVAAPIEPTPTALRPALSGGIGPGDREVTEATREALFERYPNCVACGVDRRLQVDHVVSYFHGGSSELENLQTLCRRCNVRKGTDATDFRQPRASRKPPRTWSADPSRWFYVEDVAAWECYVQREFAFFYGGGVTQTLEIGKGTALLPRWRVTLQPGIDPAPSEVVVRAIARELQARRGEVSVPHEVIVESGYSQHVVRLA